MVNNTLLGIETRVKHGKFKKLGTIPAIHTPLKAAFESKGNRSFKSLLSFLFYLLGSAYSGPPSNGVLHLRLLPFELSGVCRGSIMDLVSVQIDQIDTGKGTSL